LIEAREVHRAKKAVLDRHDLLLERILKVTNDIDALRFAIEATYYRLNVNEAEGMRLSSDPPTKSEVSDDFVHDFESSQSQIRSRKRKLKGQIHSLAREIQEKAHSLTSRSSRLSQKSDDHETWIRKSDSSIANGSPRVSNSKLPVIAEYFATLGTSFREAASTWEDGRDEFERAALKSWLSEIESATDKLKILAGTKVP
jgi:chromosome segregation ATPase